MEISTHTFLELRLYDRNCTRLKTEPKVFALAGDGNMAKERKLRTYLSNKRSFRRSLQCPEMFLNQLREVN
jgi:methyltransferase-like protein